jgi:hypothetical protein
MLHVLKQGDNVILAAPSEQSQGPLFGSRSSQLVICASLINLYPSTSCWVLILFPAL